LAAVEQNGKIVIKVRLYKYRKSSTARLLGLHDGGSGSLQKFIPTYKKETRKFKAPGEKHPVVILFDNDSGAFSIRSAIKEACGKVLKGTEPFVHVIGSLYALPTPVPNGAA